MYVHTCGLQNGCAMNVNIFEFHRHLVILLSVYIGQGLPCQDQMTSCREQRPAVQHVFQQVLILTAWPKFHVEAAARVAAAAALFKVLVGCRDSPGHGVVPAQQW